ncbi:hypothetical protein NVP1021C_10 [Vibrio phage 1.021.C._10N.222.51.F9]|nr:hypothetical protein NVP1021A_10 [Vibrio phage 1.021.A._10N.222.51.F9]AUR82123.1 hypothetical protein NVP1021B_10 [Vibrio phage 1.021.B._10N.222.51.F9]AUR82173.1 hypothetical protein NVP1021C_10 [Vibrio phage 1.021.C._10N.222.51.F9]
MILSAQQLFSDDQAVTATARSTNVIDLGVAGTPYGAVAPLNQDIGKGNKVCFLAQVTEDFDNATSVAVAIETGATDALGTVILSETIPLAELVAGKQSVIQVLPTELTERYLGVRYTVVGTAPTVGKFTTGITMGNQTNITGA